MFGFNPWVLLGGAGVLIAATTGAFFEGKHVAKGEAAQTQLHQLATALAERDAAQKRIGELEAAAAAREQQRQTIVREITREIPTIVRDPVYRNVCVTDPGVRALDRAAAAANGGDPGAAAQRPGEAPAAPAHH
jgi:hypothetical protein